MSELNSVNHLVEASSLKFTWLKSNFFWQITNILVENIFVSYFCFFFLAHLTKFSLSVDTKLA